MVLTTESDCGFPALRLAHHLDPADIFQNASYPCTHQLMIIDQEYIYHPNTPFFYLVICQLGLTRRLAS